MKFKYTSRSIEDTFTLAENIESEKFENMVICLNGDLGSGKTVFVKGFANSLGISENITSPTFNIIKEYYSGELPLFHMDVYRIDENDEIGIEDYFYKKGVTIIEWSEIVADELPSERLDININYVDDNTRLFIMEPHGSKYEDLCNAVL